MLHAKINNLLSLDSFSIILEYILCCDRLFDMLSLFYICRSHRRILASTDHAVSAGAHCHGSCFLLQPLALRRRFREAIDALVAAIRRFDFALYSPLLSNYSVPRL